MTILLRRLIKTKYRYADSRNQAHDALDRFLEGAKLGGSIFSTDKRFPNTLADGYVSTYFPDISRNIIAISNSLSWGGVTNVPKDMQNQKSDNIDFFKAEETAVQDNTKRYESLVEELTKFCYSIDCTFTRMTFERLAGAEWSA